MWAELPENIVDAMVHELPSRQINIDLRYGS